MHHTPHDGHRRQIPRTPEFGSWQSSGRPAGPPHATPMGPGPYHDPRTMPPEFGGGATGSWSAWGHNAHYSHNGYHPSHYHHNPHPYHWQWYGSDHHDDDWQHAAWQHTSWANDINYNDGGGWEDSEHGAGPAWTDADGRTYTPYYDENDNLKHAEHYD